MLLAKEVVLWHHGYLAMPQARHFHFIRTSFAPSVSPLGSWSSQRNGGLLMPCMQILLCDPSANSAGPAASHGLIAAAADETSLTFIDVLHACLVTTLFLFPQIVLNLQRRMGALLLRMTAVEAMLLQKPLLTGAYSAAPYHYISKVKMAQSLFQNSVQGQQSC